MNLKRLALATGLLLQGSCQAWYTTLNQADPYPLFTSQYPFQFLNSEKKLIIAGKEPLGIKERIDFSISMFGQKASSATNEKKEHCSLLDYNGRLNMVGMTYGSVPSGLTQPSLLATAGAQAFVGLTPPTTATISDQEFSDETQNFGFFSVNAKYHKVGLRFEGSFRPIEDIVIAFQGGYADLKQTYTTTYFDDRTDLALADVVFPGQGMSTENFTTNKELVQQYLMDKRAEIFDQIDLDTFDWHKSGPEDFTVSAIARHNFPVNANADPEEWAPFIFTPFIQAGFTAGVAKGNDPDYLLSIPLGGNNKHNAFRLRGGFGLDFFNTIEVVWDACYSHFSERTVIRRVPTSELQYMVYPYKTTVNVSPGDSWNFTVGFNAYNFLDKLSFYGLYHYAGHSKDKITLNTPDAAFLPDRLEEDTEWKVQIFDLGFNYILSPNLAFGVVFQLPVARRSAYKSYTSLLTMTATF